MTDHNAGNATIEADDGKDELAEALDKLVPEERQAQMDRLFAGDYLLTEFVELANIGLGIPITLSVGGQLITGQLSSLQVYFDHAVKLMGAVEDKKLAESLVACIEAKRPDPDKPKRVPGMPPAFIHLVDARYVSEAGDYIPSRDAKALIWRGKVASVDGFSIGQFVPVE